MLSQSKIKDQTQSTQLLSPRTEVVGGLPEASQPWGISQGIVPTKRAQPDPGLTQGVSPIPRGFHPGSRHPEALAWAGVRYRRPNGLRTRPLADWGTRSRDRSHLVTLGVYAVLPAGCCRADATPHPGSRINGGHNVQLRFLQELDRVLFPSQDTLYTAEPEGVPPVPVLSTPTLSAAPTASTCWPKALTGGGVGSERLCPCQFLVCSTGRWQGL